MNRRIRVTTWKISQGRYLHEVVVKEGEYFHLVTNSSYFFAQAFTFRNKVLKKKDPKAIKGLKQIKEEREEWLNEEEWMVLCFGGSDNLELRKKIYGKEFRDIKIVMSVYPKSGSVEWIKEKGTIKNLLPYHLAVLRKNPRKRIKDPLPYIDFQRIIPEIGERSKEYEFIISELSFILFNRRVHDWLGY